LVAPAIAWLAFASSALFGGILVIVGSRGIRRARSELRDGENF
jgi:hypothetical protein